MTFNPLYLLLILPALLGFYTQQQVRVIYKKYGANPNRRGVSGREAAQYLLAQHHLTGVRLEGTPAI